MDEHANYWAAYDRILAEMAPNVRMPDVPLDAQLEASRRAREETGYAGVACREAE